MRRDRDPDATLFLTLPQMQRRRSPGYNGRVRQDGHTEARRSEAWRPGPENVSHNPETTAVVQRPRRKEVGRGEHR